MVIENLSLALGEYVVSFASVQCAQLLALESAFSIDFLHKASVLLFCLG